MTTKKAYRVLENKRDVFTAASSVFEEDFIEVWYDKKNVFFKGQSPREMVERGKATDVLMRLYQIEYGL